MKTKLLKKIRKMGRRIRNDTLQRVELKNGVIDGLSYTHGFEWVYNPLIGMNVSHLLNVPYALEEYIEHAVARAYWKHFAKQEWAKKLGRA